MSLVAIMSYGTATLRVDGVQKLTSQDGIRQTTVAEDMLIFIVKIMITFTAFQNNDSQSWFFLSAIVAEV